jgi:Transposase DDE domain
VASRNVVRTAAHEIGLGRNGWMRLSGSVKLRSKGAIPGHNAQIAVDSAHQIIVAPRLQTSSADRALPGLRADIRAVLHANPKEVSADVGYCEEENLRHLARTALMAISLRDGHGTARSMPRDRGNGGRGRARRRWRWSSNWWQGSRHRLHKRIVEHVFGQIKQARGFRSILLRGLHKVRGEWAMICTAHSPLKLASATGDCRRFRPPTRGTRI